MKIRESILYWGYVIVLLFVYVSCLLNEAVYQVSFWKDIDRTISWQVLKVVQIMVVPPVAGILLLSFYYKLRRIKPLHSLSIKRQKKIDLMLKALIISFLVLYLATGIPLQKSGYPFEAYRLARAHGLLLIVLIFALDSTASLLGAVGTGDGSLSHDEKPN